MQTAFLIDNSVEDNALFKLAISTLPFDVRCEFADDPQLALYRLTHQINFIPDFIFINMNMPGMNGIECLKEIKKIKWLSDTCVYMYMVSNSEVVKSSCKRLGAEGVILKAPSVIMLREVLEEIFLKPRVVLG